jgi:ATP-dependent DNA helicase PIF1
MAEVCVETGLTHEAVMEEQQKRRERAEASERRKVEKELMQRLGSMALAPLTAPIAPPPLLHVVFPHDRDKNRDKCDLINEHDLNEEQKQVLEKTKEGQNVFITGGAGVGKSFVVKHIIRHAHSMDRNVGVCAMTGSAAILINGVTLHSFTGVGLAKESAPYLARRINNKYPTIAARLRELDVLLVDEVSMMNDELFDKLYAILQIIRNEPTKPFGGVQMIFVGDMMQLAPVEGNYCFTATNWTAAAFMVFLLKTNMRQRDDDEFKALLDRVRWGKCMPADYTTLCRLENTRFPEGILPTRLYSRNADVDRINAQEFEALVQRSSQSQTNQIHVYDVKYRGSSALQQRSRKYAEATKMQPRLKLCVGAQVIVTRNINIDDGLVNGARGVVTQLNPKGVMIRLASNNTSVNVEYYTLKPIPKTKEDESDIDLSYMPLKLAWAISIHASQGMTIDALEVDLGSSIFAYGQAYTGLSRARSLHTTRIVDVLPTSFKTSPAVVEFYSKYC